MFRFYIAILGGLGTALVFYVFLRAGMKDYAQGMKSMDIAFYAGFTVFYLFFLLGMLRPVLLQVHSCCFTVELFPDHLLGRMIFGKEKIFFYSNIEKIQAIKRYWFLRANILLVGSDGTELEIHHNIDYLGKCIEEIRRRSTNLKVVDYNGMDRTPEVWAAGDKHCML